MLQLTASELKSIGDAVDEIADKLREQFAVVECNIVLRFERDLPSNDGVLVRMIMDGGRINPNVELTSIQHEEGAQ